MPTASPSPSAPSPIVSPSIVFADDAGLDIDGDEGFAAARDATVEQIRPRREMDAARLGDTSGCGNLSDPPTLSDFTAASVGTARGKGGDSPAC